MSKNESSYLLLGHLTQDLTPNGYELGGTAAYAGLTALALGNSVRLVTSYPQEVVLSDSLLLSTHNIESSTATQFKNITTAAARKQYCYSQAKNLTPDSIPEEWLHSDIIHFGPVAQEIPPETITCFPDDAFLCATPQGWLRGWNSEGLVHPQEWNWAEEALSRMQAIVLSSEDLLNERSLQDLIRFCDIVAVTEGQAGAYVYWKGDVRHFPAPNIEVMDTTGAGDIFAAVFFWKLHQTHDPWAAAKSAVLLASTSVSRKGLASIPTQDEINHSMVEIIHEK